MLESPRSQAWFEALHATRPAARFCILHPAQGPLRAQILYIHPFAEELNRSRRMASLQARRLARAGYEVLQIDLHGCGDSPGEFGEASWEGWLADIAAAAAWLRARHPTPPPLWLWGLRLGCVLGVEAARRHQLRCNFLFWQALSGPTQLQQLLRLAQAGQMLANGGDNGTVTRLRETLEQGHSVQIAGYEISATMAQGMGHSRLAEPPANTGQLCWIDVGLACPDVPNPQTVQTLKTWREGGVTVHTGHVNGPAFWQVLEPPDVPALLDLTVALLDEATSAGGGR